MTDSSEAPMAGAKSAVSNAMAGALAGLSLFGFLAVARVALGPEDFVPLAQLMIVWPICYAVVAFPVQQLRARSDPSTMLVSAILCGVALAILVPAMWFYGEAFTRSDQFPLHAMAMFMPLGVLATAWSRGAAAAQRRDGLLAILVAGENLTRLALALVLWIAGAGPILFGLAVLAGFAINAAAFQTVGHESPAPVLGSPGRQMISMTIVGTMGYAALFGAPSSLALGTNSDEIVGGLLLAMAVYRAPYQIVQSMVPKLAAEFARGRWMSIPLTWLAPIGPILALFAAGGAALLGPIFMDFLVEDPDVLQRATHAAAAATTTFSAVNVVGAVALIARGQLRSTAAIWLLPGLAVLHPVLNAENPGRLFEALELYVGVVYVAQLWAWSRLPSIRSVREKSTRASLP